MNTLSEPAVTPDSAERELVARVETVYRSAPATALASVAVALCLVAVMWPFTHDVTLLAWLVIVLVFVLLRWPLVRSYRRDTLRDVHARRWIGRHVWMQSGVGLCWAVAPFLFLDESQPLGIAAYLTVTALHVAGHITGHSYYMPGVYRFLPLLLLPAVARLLSFDTPAYWTTAAALVLFLAFALTFARIQSERIGENIRLRFENDALIGELQHDKARAEHDRERAEHANADKSRFLAAVSHDLRQPLQALRLYGGALLETLNDAKPRELAQKLNSSADALQSLFDELLDLSRLESGAIVPQLHSVALAEAFAKLRLRFSPLASAKQIDLSFDTTSVTVLTDPLLFERLLGNLIDNGIRYTAHGRVEIAVIESEHDIRIDVRDTGIGIELSHYEQVFEPLFQVSNAERDRRKGFGLGLAIVRLLARALDHRVELESTPGAGSTFSVTLTRAAAAPVVNKNLPSRKAEDLLSGKCIWVIEDDDAVRDAVVELLRSWHCVAIGMPDDSCTEGAEAPDVILADYRLREARVGPEAIDRVRAAFGRQVPAALMTGDPTLRASYRGADPLLQKPVRPIQLRAVLTTLIAQQPSDSSTSETLVS